MLSKAVYYFFFFPGQFEDKYHKFDGSSRIIDSVFINAYRYAYTLQ